MKKSGRKTNQALLIFLSILLLAGLILIFQLDKGNFLSSPGYEQPSLFTPLPEKTAFLPSPSLEGKPQFTPSPLEATHGSNIKPSNIPSLTSTTSTQTPAPFMVENGWYLYRDPDNEFSFAYPTTAILTSGKNPLDLSTNINIQFTPANSYQGMTIRLEPNPGRLSGVEIAKKILEDSSGKIAPKDYKESLGSIMVGGKQAIEAVLPGANTETMIIVPLGEKFMVLAPIHNPVEIHVEPKILALFYRIVDTVQFPLENGWYLYEDPKAGFSFSYPPDVYFVTSQEGGMEFRTAWIQFTNLKGQGYQGMVVDVLSNETHQPIEQIIKEIYTTPTLELSVESIKSTVEKITVADHPAYLTSYQPFMFELCIFVPFGDHVLFIIPAHDNLDIAGSPEALELFWEIVKTFQINP